MAQIFSRCEIKLFVHFGVLLCVSVGVCCMNRQWDNPIDTEYTSAWVKLINTPEISVLDKASLFSIDNTLYFIKLGSLKNLYKLGKKNMVWITITGDYSLRNSIDAVVFQNKIYILSLASAQGTNTIYSFDPASEIYSSEIQIQNASGALDGIAAVGGKLIGFQPDSAEGGRTILYEVNPSSGSLTKITSCPQMRKQFIKGSIGSELYLMGGILFPGGEGSGELTDRVESYNISTNSWSQNSPLPVKSDRMCSADLGNNIYVFDGQTGKMFRYDGQAKGWISKTGYSLTYKGSNVSMTVHDEVLLLSLGIMRSGAGGGGTAPGLGGGYTYVNEIFIYHYKDD